MIGGVDEAGRGCVLGPLVIAIAVAKQDVACGLHEDGIRDSKMLSAGRREELSSVVKKKCGVVVLKISAEELNELMGRHVSLNEIEALWIAKGLMKLGDGVKKVYIDSPDTVPKRFEKRIRKYYDAPFELACEHHADANHPIVGAASIMAKVERDAEIAKIKKIVGYDFNSGYSSDPVTIGYLSKNLHNEKLKPYIRTKWKTIARLGQKKISEF